MDKFLSQLVIDYPEFTFKSSNHFCWSPGEKEVLYNPSYRDKNAIWVILHEIGHGVLHHETYESDIELLQLEANAWLMAQEISGKYSVKIEAEHIQNCLDSYRDWLHRRSSCPVCGNVSLQFDINHYRCFNCHTSWRVSNSRFCRPYRQREDNNKKSPFSLRKAIFT